MFAQAYYDAPSIVRIFDRYGKYIAELPLDKPTAESADESLSKLKLGRRGKWKSISGGCEAKIRFRA